MATIDRRLIRLLRDGFPAVRRPFAELGRRLGVSEREVLDRLAAMRRDGRIRRTGALVDPRRIGLDGNVMAAWRVPDERVEQVGHWLAERPEVTHAYERETRPGWPYNLYAMVHAARPADCERLLDRWTAELGLPEPRRLPTVRQWKRSSPVYADADGEGGP